MLDLNIIILKGGRIKQKTSLVDVKFTSKPGSELWYNYTFYIHQKSFWLDSGQKLFRLEPIESFQEL